MRSTLEVFLLALIEDGVRTTYALRGKVGLSVGATSPALRRLAREGLIQTGHRGARGRQEFILTADGRSTLRTEMKLLVRDAKAKPPSDPDSLLRVVALAITSRAESSAAILQQAAELLAPAALREVQVPSVHSLLVRNYLWLRAEWDRSRKKADAAAFRRLARLLNHPSKPFQKPR